MASKVAPVPGGGGGACLEPCKLRPPAAPGPNAGNHFDCVSINRGPKVRFRFGEAAMGHRSDDFAKSTPRVLVIEDDEDFGQAAVDALECAGMRTAWAANEADGMLLKRSFAPDVVLLDPGAPGTDGAGLLARIVRQGDCGVIAVSGAAGVVDRIVGLEMGADDFLAKPLHLQELLARIRAVDRRVRARAANAGPAAVPVMQVGHIQVDLDSRAVRSAGGERIALTAAEFAALESMLVALGKPVSRDRLSKAALRRPWRPDDRSVDQLIFTLRQKLSDDAEHRLIHSVRGAGYLLAARATAA